MTNNSMNNAKSQLTAALALAQANLGFNDGTFTDPNIMAETVTGLKAALSALDAAVPGLSVHSSTTLSTDPLRAIYNWTFSAAAQIRNGELSVTAPVRAALEGVVKKLLDLNSHIGASRDWSNVAQ